MNKVTEFFYNIKLWAHRPRNKKKIYIALVLLIALCFVYRFVMVGLENRRVVFNTARAATESGVAVEVMTVNKTDGVLQEPVTVHNNRAMVSGGRVGILKAGQKIGEGVITYVASNINLDTGMYAVTTRGVSDGLNYAEYRKSGFFVPSYAIKNDTVLVVVDGVAVARPVTVSGADADMSVITSGLENGDVIILSNVSVGDKVQIKNNL